MEQELIEAIAARAVELKEEFGVVSLSVFGSMARGDHTGDNCLTHVGREPTANAITGQPDASRNR